MDADPKRTSIKTMDGGGHNVFFAFVTACLQKVGNYNDKDIQFC